MKLVQCEARVLSELDFDYGPDNFIPNIFIFIMKFLLMNTLVNMQTMS